MSNMDSVEVKKYLININNKKVNESVSKGSQPYNMKALVRINKVAITQQLWADSKITK